MPLASALVYVVLSAGLIFYNKYLLSPSRFPYPIALTTLHMGATSMLCRLLFQTRARSMFTSVDIVLDNPEALFRRLLPVSIAFTLTVLLSNCAYTYNTVPFMQMCKEMNPVFVYAFALVLMQDAWSNTQAFILLIVLLGGVMAVRGEVTFNAVGMVVQLSSQFFDVCKILLTVALLSRHGLGLDPLTYMMFLSPLAAVFTASIMFTWEWDSAIPQHFQAAWPHVVASCLLAFSLNIASATAMKHLSGLSYVLTGLVKDVAIVALPSVCGGVHLPFEQVIGFTLSVFGVFLHGTRKVYLEEQEQRMLLKGEDTPYGSKRRLPIV